MQSAVTSRVRHFKDMFFFKDPSLYEGSKFQAEFADAGWLEAELLMES